MAAALELAASTRSLATLGLREVARHAGLNPNTFYRHFKQLAVIGYYASEQIGEHVLNYDPIPGTFEGCVPAETIGNAWSL